MDIFTAEQRSALMSRIRSANTKPELTIRKGLHSLGYRYSLHRKDLPGQPDLVLRKHNAVIFVHGCFWHGHDCHLFRHPKTNTEWWDRKLERNRKRDLVNIDDLEKAGWRILVVWECAMRGKYRLDTTEMFNEIITWIESTSRKHTIQGVNA
ncbi:MAG: very short patch repair endonuclease [Candidatus Thorarchaeota archaeon]